MKTTTTAYNNAINGQMRPKGNVKITLMVNASTEYLFQAADITSCEKNHKISPLSQSLPTEQFTFSILDPSRTFDPENPTGQWSVLSKNTKVKVEWGLNTTGSTYYYLTPDYYYLEGKPTYNNFVANFTATSILLHLTDKENSGLAGPTATSTYSATEMVRAIADASGKVTSGELSINTDSWLQYLTFEPFGMQNVTSREALQQVMHAVGGTFYTRSATAYFRLLTPVGMTSQKTLTRKDIIENGEQIQVATPLKNIYTNNYSYSFANPVMTLYNEDVDVEGGQTIRCEYNSALAYPGAYAVVIITPIQVSANLTYTTKQCLHAVEITFAGRGGKVNISVEALTLSQTNEIATRTYSADDDATDVMINNGLIANRGQQSVAACQTQAWSNQNTFTLTTRGNPEIEVGDCITITRPDNSTVKCLVIANAIRFDGAFSGKMTLMAVPTSQTLACPQIYRDEASTNIVHIPRVPFAGNYVVYVDDAYKCDLAPGSDFNIDTYVSDTLFHRVTVRASHSNYTMSELSNTITAGASSAVRYSTPTAYYTEVNGRQAMQIDGIENGAAVVNIYIDGVFQKAIPVTSTMYIDGTAQTYTAGAQWGEWLLTAYNTLGLVPNLGNRQIYNASGTKVLKTIQHATVYYGDIIQGGMIYILEAV